MTRSWEIYLGYEKSILNFVQEVFILITIQIFSQGIIFFSSSLHKFLSHRINCNKIAKKLTKQLFVQRSKNPSNSPWKRRKRVLAFRRKKVCERWLANSWSPLSFPPFSSLSLSLPPSLTDCVTRNRSSLHRYDTAGHTRTHACVLYAACGKLRNFVSSSDLFHGWASLQFNFNKDKRPPPRRARAPPTFNRTVHIYTCTYVRVCVYAWHLTRPISPRPRSLAKSSSSFVSFPLLFFFFFLFFSTLPSLRLRFLSPLPCVCHQLTFANDWDTDRHDGGERSGISRPSVNYKGIVGLRI